MQSVGNRVGVTEPFLMRMAHGASFPAQNRTRGKKSALSEKLQTRNVADNSLSSNERTLRVSRRFYVALMLSRLVQVIQCFSAFEDCSCYAFCLMLLINSRSCDTREIIKKRENNSNSSSVASLITLKEIMCCYY